MDATNQVMHDDQTAKKDQDPIITPTSETEITFPKKEKDNWTRNTLISLYSLGGFAGIALLTTVTVSDQCCH